MTHDDLNAKPAIQRARERIQQRQQAQTAAVAVQGMVQEQAARQAQRAQHQQVATVPETAPARRERQQLDGQTVLGYVRAWLGHYARLPDSAADLVTLWAAHACAKDNDGVMVWDATPRLMFLSDEPGSGKSRALELVSLLCASRYGLLAEPTSAVVAHILGSMRESAFLDEADVLFGAGKRKEALRAILNAGYTRAGVVLRMRGSKPVEDKVFGPVALAGLDVLKTATGGTLAPLLSRAVIIRMHKSGDRIPQLNSKTRQEGTLLHAALAAWAQQERDTLEQDQAGVPEWMTGRTAEIWECLFRLARAAGGDWPERVEIAAEDYALAAEVSDSETPDLMAGLEAMAGGWQS